MSRVRDLVPATVIALKTHIWEKKNVARIENRLSPTNTITRLGTDTSELIILCAVKIRIANRLKTISKCPDLQMSRSGHPGLVIESNEQQH